jgi:hypothetical protein
MWSVYTTLFEKKFRAYMNDLMAISPKRFLKVGMT